MRVPPAPPACPAFPRLVGLVLGLAGVCGALLGVPQRCSHHPARLGEVLTRPCTCHFLAQILGLPGGCREPRSSCWAEVAGSGTSPMGGDDDPALVPPSLVALAIRSHESGRGCYLEAPGWHLSRVGDLRMGTSGRDAGGEGWGVSGRADGTCPSPTTCPGLPGHAGTCLAVRSPCLCAQTARR